MRSFVYDSSQSPSAPCVDATASNPDLSGVDEVVRFIVDTGADQTVVPAAAIHKLQLTLSNRVSVRGFGGAGTILNEYEVTLAIAGLASITIAALSAIPGLTPVLGRDVLNRYRIVLDGPRETLEIG